MDCSGSDADDGPRAVAVGADRLLLSWPPGPFFKMGRRGAGAGGKAKVPEAASAAATATAACGCCCCCCRHCTLLLLALLLAFLLALLLAISCGRDDDVTDKVQTPNKVQTVADKVQIVSAHLQGAPCRRQFAPCCMSPQSRVAQFWSQSTHPRTHQLCQNVIRD